MFHYHLNREFPFSVGCFRGSVDYFSALGSIDMRETLLPLYSRSYAAAKLRNARAQVAGLVGLDASDADASAAAGSKAGALAGFLTQAAAEVEALASRKWNGTA